MQAFSETSGLGSRPGRRTGRKRRAAGSEAGSIASAASRRTGRVPSSHTPLPISPGATQHRPLRSSGVFGGCRRHLPASPVPRSSSHRTGNRKPPRDRPGAGKIPGPRPERHTDTQNYAPAGSTDVPIQPGCLAIPLRSPATAARTVWDGGPYANQTACRRLEFPEPQTRSGRRTPLRGGS